MKIEMFGVVNEDFMKINISRLVDIKGEVL